MNPLSFSISKSPRRVRGINGLNVQNLRDIDITYSQKKYLRHRYIGSLSYNFNINIIYN